MPLPEGVLLVAFPLGILIALGAAGRLSRGILAAGFWENSLYFLFFGWQFFFLTFALIFSYLWIRFFVRRFGKTRDGSVRAPRIQRRAQARSLAFLTLGFSIALLVNVAATTAVYRPSPERAAWASELAMRSDHAIFGGYPPFSMQTSPLFRALGTPMLVSYVGMSSALSVIFLGLLLFRPKLFREYVLSFFMIMFVSLPLWVVFPAISPDEMYRMNVMQREIPRDIEKGIESGSASVDPKVVRFSNGIEQRLTDPATGRYAASDFPSEHVAWGTLIMYYGIVLFPPLTLLLVPWWALNALGAVYALQHYAVDVPAGMLVAALSVWIVRGLIALEYRLGIAPPAGYALLDAAREDVRESWRALRG